MPYDEIIAGGNIYNLGFEYYIWNNLPSRAVTPQILFTTTNFEIIVAGHVIGNVKREEYLLKRLSGVEEIETFYDFIKNNTNEDIKSSLGII